MKIHEIVCYPADFQASLDGDKNFQVTSQPDLTADQYVKLREFEPCPECRGQGRIHDGYMDWDDCHVCERRLGTFTGRELLLVITHVTTKKELPVGIFYDSSNNFCILGTRLFTGNFTGNLEPRPL